MEASRRFPLLHIILTACVLLPVLVCGDDGSTLLSLKGAIQGSSGSALSTWTSSSFYCTWQGVSCDSSTVFKLDLSNQGLSGSIVDVINAASGLTGLQYLYLNNNELSGGPIPDSLGQLTQLIGLHLQNNNITGGLPDVFTGLTGLVELLVSYNYQLGGTIPSSLQACTDLQSLDMSSTALTGTIPTWMGQFQQMRLLYLGTNNLTGTIPPLDGLSSLMELYLNINQLTGSIPSTLGKLTTLTKLYLDRLDISGPIPSSLGGLSSLKSFYLDNTFINGTIPSALSSLLPTLTALDLRYTNLVGTVPSGLLTNAIVCDGYAPWGWPAASGADCLFDGNPSLVCPTGSTCVGSTTPTATSAPVAANATAPSIATRNSTNGTALAPGVVSGGNSSAPVSAPATNTSVIAPSPAGVNATSGSLNTTSGSVNTTSGSSVNATSGSSVSASAPAPGVNTPSGTNTTSGTAPGNLTSPIVCPCPANQTAGLGSVAGRCNCVYGLGASFKLLDRNLSDWTQNFQGALIGALATQLGIQPYQILVANAAQGSILLDTNMVPLIGTTFTSNTATNMENVLENKNGQALNMNETAFGRVLVTAVTPPALVTASTPGSSTPTSAATPGAPGAPGAAGAPGSSGSNTGAIVGGIVGAIAAVLVAAIIVGLLLLRRRRRRLERKRSLFNHVAPAGSPFEDGPSFVNLPSKSMTVSVSDYAQFPPPETCPVPPSSPSGANIIKTSPWRSSSSPSKSPSNGSDAIAASPWKSDIEAGGSTDSGYRGGHETTSRTTRMLGLRESTEVLPPWREFTSEEIRLATDNYSRANILGSGLFGTVFKAVFPDGKLAAVKRAEIAPSVLTSRQAEFQRELETLSQLRHRHLVPFLGFCEVASRELMLVYDFMPNGTLQDNLPGGCRGILDWPARVKVAVQVASAIDYLHNGCRPPIVHRDIKANNILLDQNDSAYLGDFGLATLYDAERSHITTAIKGTPGYLDPQYFATQELTQRSDVYSFGVLLLSIVAGKKAIFSVSELDPTDPDRARLQRQAIGKVNLTTWAVPLIREGHAGAIVDRTIPDVEKYWHDIEIVAEVAAECVQDRSQDRPNMSEVLVRLRGVLALVEQ